MLNITQVCGMSPDNFILESYKLSTIPLVAITIFSLLVFLVVGLITLKNPKSKSKFWKIWIISSVLIIVVLFGLIMFPGTITQLISNFYT